MMSSKKDFIGSYRYCIGTAFVESRNDLHVDALLDVDRTNSSQKKQQRWYWKFPQPLTRNPSDEWWYWNFLPT